MSSPKQEHFGSLRPQVSVTPDGRIKVEWVAPDRTVVWTETMENQPGRAAMSQIECDGKFAVRSGMYVERATGKRHFILNAEAGRLGAPFG